ncbi:hypothetical protein ABZP36_027738 [Zizania latifolia]
MVSSVAAIPVIFWRELHHHAWTWKKAASLCISSSSSMTSHHLLHRGLFFSSLYLVLHFVDFPVYILLKIYMGRLFQPLCISCIKDRQVSSVKIQLEASS